MKILLTTLNAKYIHLNLAIRLLYELNEGHPGLSWKEFTIKESKDDVADYCSGFDLVAFSCYIWNITQTLEVCRKIKTINPDINILLGGPEVSYDWEDVIVRPEVDMIITGEGEIPFTTLLKNYPNLSTVPGLIHKQNGEIIRHPEAGMFDLNEFTHARPYRHDPVETLRTKVLYIETSRGCPYKCEFCLASLDNKMRYLPQESLKANLLYLMEHGRVIKFLDRTFNIKRDFTLDIFQFILDNHRPENVFQFEITADIIHPEIIAFIQEKVPQGLFRFEIGIQTVNQKANLEVSRKQNFDKTRAIIRLLENKVEMHLDLIVGLPLDYWDDIKYSFEEVFKLFAPELQLGFLKFLKGTPVRHKYEQHGYLFDPEPPYQIIESNYLSKQELADILLLEDALEIYWNKKRTPHTLRYITLQYSIFNFLLELGLLFGQRVDKSKHYSLETIFEVIDDCVKKVFPDDPIVAAMLALDYYEYHRIKPRTWPDAEIPETERKYLQQTLNMDNRFRYAMLSMPFDVKKWKENNTIIPDKQLWIIRYDGTSDPVGEEQRILNIEYQKIS